ncbi:hypothetical protein K2X30_11930 [bacterium]|jgi:hypothetical protein|nr:hypothetical protein [bacterium]
MKKILFLSLFVSTVSLASPDVPTLKLEYSYALDWYCPLQVVPETLTPAQAALIPKIPIYRDQELLAKISWFQSEWDKQGTPLLAAAAHAIGKPYPMKEISGALFLCPRLPFMGTPLSFNVISYLNLSAKDIPALGGRPMPVFFFVSTAFHEVLHKYIYSILEKSPSTVLKTLHTNLDSLYGAHLHLFALQKKVFTDLRLERLLPAVGKLEASHGSEYLRAWKTVHQDEGTYQSLLSELRN